ncbi:hypothetical protein FH608_025195 [Nonomuraea phyllanthi]|uniref:Uncharacterized protein n=1 Tax=Nonomuraea phyllanthi TaxID=2219224 RepID=A0A5C4WC19_9ACTN|nr:hypothetical protein [Nonomuraea phyllanthi]KAB8192766.1 hypothetical protein FH608_025195 [Nonomuraea phyllanthi]QFY08243.1 hypothetical protein GBF35_17575 [Nonomuraea phyllanthi]
MSRRTAVVAIAVLAVVPASAPTPESPILPSQARHLWPDGGVVVRGARSVVVGHHAAPGELRDLARRADAAGRRVAEVLGGPVRPLIVVPGTAAEAAALARVGSVDGLAAVADRGRVIVVPEVFARLNSTGKDVVLAHELTHVTAGTDGLPIWLYEGFADYVGYRDSGLPVRIAAAELAVEVRAGRIPGELPGPAAFAADGRDPLRLARAYQEAWLACRFIADRFGEGTLVRLYREARANGVDQALAALGLSAATLTARWRDYVRDQLA